MSRLLDLIRASALPSHQMMTAARGALQVPAAETVEILVYLAEHNKIFGESARLTLAGWDEASSKAIASDPKTAKEVLDYWLSPRNIRPALFPILLENQSVLVVKLSELAPTLKGERSCGQWCDDSASDDLPARTGRACGVGVESRSGRAICHPRAAPAHQAGVPQEACEPRRRAQRQRFAEDCQTRYPGPDSACH